MNDLIRRQSAIEEIARWIGYIDEDMILRIQIGIKKLPSAQPEVKPISYTDCANALMMMWIDNVLTDGEYKKIMDKLNAHEMKKREGDKDERSNQKTRCD